MRAVELRIISFASRGVLFFPTKCKGMEDLGGMRNPSNMLINRDGLVCHHCALHPLICCEVGRPYSLGLHYLFIFSKIFY